MAIEDQDLTPSYVDSFTPIQAKQEVKTNIVGSILGGTVATIGDFSASVWNSLTPERMNVETEDLLRRVNTNALNIYQENEDTIHAASFIGGVFVPAGVALKGMNALRSGTKGVNWFSDAGKSAQLSKINDTIKESGIATAAYKNELYKLYARNFANVAVDNLAAEIAILGTLNAHPFMEDYMQDVPKSFMTSMLLGVGITAPLSHIGVAHEVRKLGQNVYEQALGKIKDVSGKIDSTADASTQISQYQRNIENWEGLLAKKDELKLDGVTQELLSSFVRFSKSEQLSTFDAIASPAMREMPQAFKDNVIKMIHSQPERFAGINSIEFATAKEELSLLKKAYGKLTGSTKLAGEEIPLTKTNTKGEVETHKMIYSPRFDAFMSKADFQHFGTAADLTNDADSLTKGMTNHWFRTPNYDASLEQLAESSAYIDLDYLRKLKAVDEMSVTDLSKIAVAPDDGPMLNAVIARLTKLGAEDPAAAASLKVILTKNEPNWNAIEKELFRQVPSIPVGATNAGARGVRATYLDELKSSVEKNWDQYDLFKSTISRYADSMLRGWKNGSGMTKMRQAVDDAFRSSQYARHGASITDVDAVKEIYNSAASKGLRDSLMQVADNEGYVYLYRGLRKAGFGSSAVESYTTNAAKAAEFGTPKLYKVHVNDVLGGIRDIAGKAGYGQSTEVLVMSHTRAAVKDLPIAERALTIPQEYFNLSHFAIEAKGLKSWDKQNLKNLTINLHEDFLTTNPLGKFTGTPEEYKAQLETFIKSGLDDYIKDVNAFNAQKAVSSSDKKLEAGLSELLETAKQYKVTNIQSMLAQGMPVESISIRTNTPIESVKALMAGANANELNLFSYTNAAEVAQHIGAENRGIQLGTTATKVPVAQLRAQLHKKQWDDVDATVKDLFLASSSSSIAKGIGEFLRDPIRKTQRDLLKASIEKITPAHLGNKFFQSTDFALRDMGEAGQIITAMGKDASHLYTKYTNEVVKPVSDAFARITKDPAGIIEFNTAREVNAAIRGYRELRIVETDGVRTGKFFYQDPNVPWKDVADPLTGKIVKERNMIEADWKGQSFDIKTPSVLDAFEEMQRAGREMYALNSTYRKTLGQSELNDLGFWMPAFNPRDKYITYVFDKVNGTTRLLWGNTPEELESAKNAFKATLNTADNTPGNIVFVDKGTDQALYNKLEGRHDPMFMSVADVSQLHSGASALARVPSNASAFSELANAYEHYIHRSVGNILELQYSDVLGHLDNLSFAATKGIEGQPVGAIQKALNRPNDAAMIIKNTLLGKSNLKEYTGWQSLQNGVQTGIELTLQSISKVMEPVLNPAKGILGKGKSLSDAEYENLIKEMDLRGIPNPFAGMDEALAKEVFHTEKISQAPNLTPRAVAISNNLAATFLLRVMELGQPLVNALSLPVLTSAAVQKTFSKEFMGATLAGNGQFSTIKAMYSGARFLGHPDYQKYKKMGEELGIFKPVVSEVSELLQQSRSFNPGVLQKVENALSSKTVELLSKPADWSESAVREFSFATGVQLAKQAYPGISDAGVMTFARNFVDVAIGNYNPAQRPVAFQGSLGVAMGLFQTYMVTLAQQIYRRFELRDYKALSKIMLTQANIFGVKSLPGFNQVSELIGEHFSDQNYDLTTGTYRALPSEVADIVLYGMPSNFGPAVYTRGDIQPRLPNIAGGLQNLAAVNILSSAYKSSSTLLRAAGEIGDEGAFHAFAEALSVQSVSRPVARLSELFTGHSVTGKGNEVAGPEEIYSLPGISARIFSTRSLQENKAREAMHLNSMYGSVDREQRQEATRQLKNHIRSGTLNPDILDRIQEKYMRTGSPTGWRSAYQTAIAQTDAPGVSAVREYLSPNSPTQLMIEDLD